ncbi:MAG: NADH-quinone oxidoreductase subunit L [Actinobacteria bacterium]|nr:NADH-quinone oxidoreductase subunit L [Actinomycetota bacterium]
MEKFIWVIPVLPVFGFIITLFFGKRSPKAASIFTTIILGACVLLSLASIFIFNNKGPLEVTKNLYVTGKYSITMGFAADGLTVMMLNIVSIVSFLVHLYSIGYMHNDTRFWMFFMYLQLFSASMFGLVLSNNYLQLYIFWELVGLCSYLLIGFWYEKKSAANAAKKAFLTTKIGDVGMLIGIFLLFFNSGSTVFKDVFKFAAGTGVSQGLLTASAILLFCGAIGKSAQFPLHIWLPDAMEGPTPVSALIHAATMVAAGVYLVGRSFPIFSLSAAAMQVVAVVGAFTAIFAATIAITQNDIKKVLAYSTISQLGYMMFALGMGAYVAGMFHLMTHAFFKALLFLGSGSVIHATGTQDIREMGGLFKKMKVTAITFIIGTLALSGFPLTAGFFSKDYILGFAYSQNKYVFFIIGIITAFFTAFYMFRVIFVVFFGKPRKEGIHAHESPKVMTIPLIILAVLSVVTGYFGAWFIPERFSIDKFISFFGFEGPEPLNIVPMLIAVFIGLLGIFAAFILYLKKPLAGRNINKWIIPFYKLINNKYYIDEIYGFILIRPLLKIAGFVNSVDKVVIDGFVNLTGKFTVVFSKSVDAFDSKAVDGAVNKVADAAYLGGRKLRKLQTGDTSSYLAVMFGAVAIFVIYILIRVIFIK